MGDFTYSCHPARVVFGDGSIDGLRAEVERLGRARALVLSGPRLVEVRRRAREVLGPLAVAEFGEAAMHTPVEVTERALQVFTESGADCVVALGGGSTIGLSKALALRTDTDQVVVPTTYAGSEVTSVLGETANGEKVTTSSPRVLPETVVYDVALTRDLPAETSLTSGLNAMAHAVEALYAPQANPLTDGVALQAISGLAAALPGIIADPVDMSAREEALRAAWLAGTCLGSTAMGLHHKLCHVLGGTFGLPHAETHTVLLPHVMAHNATAAPDSMRRIARALGATDAPVGMFDLVDTLGGPTALRALGMPESGITEAARLAVAAPYPNPREPDAAEIEALLRAAWAGGRPAPHDDGGRLVPDLTWLTDQVAGSFAGTPDARVHELVTGLVRQLHQFISRNDVTEDEWRYAIDFLTRTGAICSDTRQEFVLLSDILGVSSFVDFLTNSRTPRATASAVLGPFYVEGPPAAEHGSDISAGQPGTPLWADITVTDTDDVPVSGALVDVWQSNDEGYYDVQLPDLDSPVLRARFRTGSDGRLTFWTILPSEYPIPDDGPVGEALRAVGRHPYRAPHLHFMIMAAGHRRLVTQLFVNGGAYLDSDAVFGVKDELIVDFAPQRGPTPDGRRIEGEWRRLDFTFRIARLPEGAGQPSVT